MEEESVPTVKVVNSTEMDLLPVALIQGTPGDDDVIVWRVVEPAPGGFARVPVPQAFEVHVTSRVGDVEYETNRIVLDAFSALLKVEGVRDPASGVVTIRLTTAATGLQAPEQGHVVVDVPPGLGFPVQVHVTKDGTDVLPPVTSPPGSRVNFGAPSSLYRVMAFLGGVAPGFVMPAGMLGSAGSFAPGQQVVVTGDEEKGFSYAVSDT